MSRRSINRARAETTNPEWREPTQASEGLRPEDEIANLKNENAGLRARIGVLEARTHAPRAPTPEEILAAFAKLTGQTMATADEKPKPKATKPKAH